MSRLNASCILAAVLALSCAPRQAAVLEDPTERPTRTIVQTMGATIAIVESTGGGVGVVAHQVSSPADDIWNALPVAFRRLGFRNAQALNDEKRIFGTPDAVLPRMPGRQRLSTFLDCGRGPAGENADSYRVTGTVTVAVRALDDPRNAGEASMVEVVLEASARPRNVSGHPVRCSSTGRLERLIVETAAAEIAGVGKEPS